MALDFSLVRVEKMPIQKEFNIMGIWDLLEILMKVILEIYKMLV